MERINATKRFLQFTKVKVDVATGNNKLNGVIFTVKDIGTEKISELLLQTETMPPVVHITPVTCVTRVFIVETLNLCYILLIGLMGCFRMLLDSIHKINDLRGLGVDQLKILSDELRSYIIDVVSKTAGISFVAGYR